jgi:hypothetical protein
MVTRSFLNNILPISDIKIVVDFQLVVKLGLIIFRKVYQWEKVLNIKKKKRK